MSKKTCFVVSAIGQEKSEVRNHSDSVLKHIIKPALSDKYDVTRADELYHSDKIDEKIFKALSDSDLAIVDITGNNPNVFLELGYRKALDLPTIFLRQQTDEDIPFDIRTINIIQYDLKNASGTNMLDSVQKTIERIQKTEETLDFSALKNKNNDGKDYVTTQEFSQLTSTINNIYDAVEKLSHEVKNISKAKHSTTQEDIIMMAFQNPEKLEKFFELQNKYPSVFSSNNTN